MAMRWVGRELLKMRSSSGGRKMPEGGLALGPEVAGWAEESSGEDGMEGGRW
jgi:hypothetical protein